MSRFPLPLVALTALLLSAASCSSESVSGSEPPGGEAVAFQNVADTTFTEVAAGQYGNYDFTGQSETKHLVLDSEEAFAEFWSALHANRSAVPARPQIDFSEQVVVAALMPPQHSGGYDIEIADITTAGNGTARVHVVETEPGPTCAVTMALTQPYHIVKADRPDGGFSFTTETVVRECGS